MKLKYIIIFLIFISLLGKFILIHFNKGLWWDEAVYLGLSKSLTKGYYSLDQNLPIESFRPPLFPVVIALFSNSIFLSRIIVAIISVLSVISLYFLTKELFNKEMAILASLFLSTNPLFIFFTGKVLSEALFILFFSISLLFFTKQNSFLSGFFTGVAFITRYLGIILILSYFLYFFIKGKVKKIYSFLLGLAIPLLPWFLISNHYYFNPLGSILTNFKIYTYVEPPITFTISQFFTAFGFVIIFIAIGTYFYIKDSKDNLLTLLVLLPILFFILLPHMEIRYLLSFLPVYAITASYSVFKLRNIALFMAIVFCLHAIIIGFQMTWEDRFAASSLVQASLYLKNTTNETIVSVSYPYIYYLTERRCAILNYNHTIQDLYFLLEKYNASYIVLYKFEPLNPLNISQELSLDQNFKPIKRFEQWNDDNATIIYKWVKKLKSVEH